jgi:hypothetical protein
VDFGLQNTPTNVSRGIRLPILFTFCSVAGVWLQCNDPVDLLLVEQMSADYIRAVPTINLTDDELAAVTAAIRRAIETDRFLRAPRLDSAALGAGEAWTGDGPKANPAPEGPVGGAAPRVGRQGRMKPAGGRAENAPEGYATAYVVV